ncbi:MAG: hypothetical protein FK734_00515 [Asgard group archaeon]|nr:hypothetical protein [Asgard group archaeon]
MRGNPVAYRNLHKHLVEILNYLEISLDADFVLEELDAALYECESTFGKRHKLSIQLRSQMKYLYNKYLAKKELPLEKRDQERLKSIIDEWLKKYYRKIPS